MVWWGFSETNNQDFRIDGIALTTDVGWIKWNQDVCSIWIDGKKIDYLPSSVEDQLKIKPIYENFPGWRKPPKE